MYSNKYICCHCKFSFTSLNKFCQQIFWLSNFRSWCQAPDSRRQHTGFGGSGNSNDSFSWEKLIWHAIFPPLRDCGKHDVCFKKSLQSLRPVILEAYDTS